jgi:hypothetical protein
MMVNYARIARHIDKGLGKAAEKLGQPFNGFRPDSASTGDFPSGWTQTSANFSLFRRRISAGNLEMGLEKAALWYNVIGNMGPYLLGDVFVQNDPAYVAGLYYGPGATSIPGTAELNAMCLAWHAPVDKRIGARIDRRVKIYRPSSSPATETDGSGYWKSTLDNDCSLTLTAGVYSFGAPGANNANWVPAGLSAVHRQSQAIFEPNVPGMLKPSKWFFYVPPLPGYVSREGDAIVDENGARYVVISPYEQQTGVVGNQLICDRKISQPDPPSTGPVPGKLDFSQPGNPLLPGLAGF